jgi:hypothetical protein
MKTQEEIEEMANDFVSLAFSKQDLYDGFINGYFQCQQDMAAKKYTEEDMLGFLNFYNEFDFNKLGYRYRHPSMDGSEKKYNQDIHKKIIKHFIESLNKQDK